MTMPSPFELGGAIGSNIGGAVRGANEQRSLEDILAQIQAGQNPENIGAILSRFSPERQQVAQNALSQRSKQNAYKAQGLDPSISNLDPAIQKELVKNKSGGAKINPEVQKWAYKELEKKAPIQALGNSIKELRRLNESGVTGPAAGRTPSFLADKEADAIRKAIDANAIQILNVHKSMFPRGLTQGEFNTLSQKLVSSKNTKEANSAILDAYEKLGKLQESKLQAVEEATQKYGFDPMLPFIVSGIQKQYDDKEAEENRKLYETVMKTGSEKPKSGEGKKIKLRHAASGSIAEVPEEKYLSLPESERKIYERL